MQKNDPGCQWGIGIEFPKVAGATAYLIKYWDGYWKRTIVGTATPKQLTTDPDAGAGTLYSGVTGGSSSNPCAEGAGDPTEGGRFKKGATVYALFAAGYKPQPPDGLDWKMPPRLNEETWRGHEGLPAPDMVHPDEWKVSLFLTRKKALADPCSSDGGEWRWTVEGPKGAKVVDKPKAGCTTSMAVSRLGTYSVTATEYERHKGKLRKTSTHVTDKVVVKDWLIVGMGDSNGSGEGNPPFGFEQCNRSEASYQFQAAQYVESHDPRSSVTFVFPACSGAIIQDLYKTKYEGIRPGAPLDPQIKQAASLIDEPADPPSAQRKVDAAILSIGVNNLGFGPLLKFCITNLSPVDACQDRFVTAVPNARGGITEFDVSSAPTAPTLKAELDSLVAALPAKYGPLAKALSAPLSPSGGGTLGVKSGHVVITQYPDFTRGSDGQLCSGTLGPQSTWGFVEQEAAGLNAAVAKAAATYGWKPVAVPQSTFTGPPTGHGYCASDSYFVPVTGAFTVSNLDGGFHPTGTGHTITAEATRAKLCTALYGNAKCDGKPS